MQTLEGLVSLLADWRLLLVVSCYTLAMGSIAAVFAWWMVRRERQLDDFERKHWRL